MFPPVRGTHEMIGAGNNLEVEAGYRMLEQGGNAVDAAAAAILAATVTEQDHIGLGGEAPIIVKMAGKPVVVISGVGVAAIESHGRLLSASQGGAVGRSGTFRADSRARACARRSRRGPWMEFCWRSKNSGP